MRVAFLGNFQVDFTSETHWAGSFELDGHEVTRLQEGETRAVDVPDLVAGHDLFFWVQTYGLAVSGGTLEERADMLTRVRTMGIPSVGAHLDKWFDLGREDQLAVEPYFHVDHLFTADGGNQDRFAALGINHHWMPPGVYEPECVPGTPRPEFDCDVAFVGNWRGEYHIESQHRFALIEWLQRRYGNRLGLWPKRSAIRGRDLADLYATARVVVGDSCLIGTGLDHGRYWSDRIPETVGRAGLLLHPYVDGLRDHFTPGEHLDCWDAFDWDRLRVLIDHYIDNPDDRDRVRMAGHEHVLKHHTYTQRVREIIETIGGPAQATRLDPPMIPTLMNGKWELLLPEHRADRYEWTHPPYWEPERLESMHANLRPGDLIIDVGAEEGDMPGLYASWGCDVILAEPNPRVWANIRAVFDSNELTDQVRACWVGFLGDEVRAETAEWGEQNGEGGSPWPRCADGPVISDHGFAVIVERPDIPVTTVDLLTENVGVPQAITMDVEGSEYRVLKGAEQTLRQHRPLVWVSIHTDLQWMEEKFPGEEGEAVRALMNEVGYTGLHLATDHEQHWFFYPNERADSVTV